MEAHPHFRSIDPVAPSQPFLLCCFARNAGLCLPNWEASRTELLFAVAPSEVVAVQRPVQNVSHEMAIHHQVVSDLASSLSLAAV
jgi:hypothetical protein